MRVESAEAYFQAKAEIKDLLREIAGGNLKLEQEACKIFDNDPEGLFRELIFQLVNVRLPKEHAQEAWEMLLGHRQWMSRCLQRTVPLRNAAYDYFTSVDPQLQDARILSRESYKQLLEIGQKDTVTGLGNRLAFNGFFAQEVERAVRYNSRFTLTIIDVDHFKVFNDAYGHKVGDQVLKTVAGIINSMIRKLDQAFRLGGDEFVLVLPEVTSREAKHLADRIRKKVAKIGFKKKLTVSCGLATFRDDTSDPQKLFTFSDSSLYVAKDKGRNCVATFSDTDKLPNFWERMKLALKGKPWKPAPIRRF